MRRLLWLVVACSPAPVRTTVSVPVFATPTAPVIAHTTLCERFLDAQHTEIAAVITKSRRGDPEAWKNVTDTEIYSQPLGIACHPFHGGAWAVAMVGSPTIYASWKSIAAELVAVAFIGDERIVGSDTYHAGYGADFTTVHSQLASDYDGDGVPELWMFSRTNGPEGGHFDKSGLYTAKTDVTAYGPTSKFADFGVPTDVDGDGLMDLPTSTGISLGTDVDCEGKTDVDAADFLAHAKRDGTFSLDDAVAKSYVHSWCPAAPATMKTATDALCARLWKKPPTKCVPWDCAAERQGQPQPRGADKACEARMQAVSVPPPFTLP